MKRNCILVAGALLVLAVSSPRPAYGAAPTPAPFQGTSPKLSESLTAVYDLLTRGRYGTAEEQVTGIDDPMFLRIHLELAARRGDHALSERLAHRLLTLHQLGQLHSSEGLAQAAFAAWHLDEWHQANDIYLEASRKEPATRSLFVDWGNLYLEKYNAAEAEEIFQDAIEAPESDQYPERWGLEAAYIGMSRALRDQGKPGSEEMLGKAEEVNPESLLLIAARATEGISESRWDDGQKWLRKGFDINPDSDPLLELQAAYHYLLGEDKEFEKLKKRILQVNPSDGSLFETLGDFCIPRRRLQEAIQFYREAVEKDPGRWSALASLGINLLRMGQEDEGKRILERAYANDPFNIWTVNTLRLLDSFENFVRFETPHFRVKIEKSEADALRPYVEELLETSIETLSRKYEHPISESYIFEMYNNHADFAVRTLGLPGLGALGATFGRVVAMDSPSARPGGKFHWGSTLWHELAHVVTLSLSNEKVPRWLTEGISMMEERLARDGWGDFLTPSFVRAYEEDKLLSLQDLNSGFERPRFPGQLELSYFQAGWICDFLAANYGFDRIRAMLVAFGEEKSMEEVFQEVLGRSVEEIDQEFHKRMEATIRPLVTVLAPPPEIPNDDPDLGAAALLAAANDNPGNYALNLRAGLMLFQSNRKDEAIPLFEKAIELFPYTAGDGSPYDFLTQIYEEQGNVEQTIDNLKRHWEVAPRIYETGAKLARLLMARQEREAAVEVLEGVMFVDPLQPEAHRMLGEAYLEKEDGKRAAREFQVLLALNPGDRAGAHYGLARAHLLNGEGGRARRQVLMALEIAPSYEEAQKLLLRLVRQ